MRPENTYPTNNTKTKRKWQETSHLPSTGTGPNGIGGLGYYGT